MKLLRRLLIQSHRYLGIALCLLAIMWFASGFVMMYAGGLPRLSPELRLERMPDVDLSKVRLSPAEAVERLGDDPGGGRVVLLSVFNRPAYRVGGATIFADTGETLDPLSLAQSRTMASRFLRVADDHVSAGETITSADQWTLEQRGMPLHKFTVDDGNGTEIYIQPRTGEVVTLTTRKSRLLAWMGTIPHWMYFTALRMNQPVWYRAVVWTSGAVCVLAALGLVLTFTQFRKTRPFRLAAAIPYSGAMRWHYVTGAVFGVFTLTWAFSGLISMEPFEWTNARGLEVRRDVFTGGPLDLSRFPAMKADRWNTLLGGRAIREVEFTRIQDGHYFVVRQAPETAAVPKQRERLHQPYYVTGRAEPDRVLVDADTLAIRHEPFSADSLVARLRAEVTDVPVVESTLLSDYDSYYYSRGRLTPLPVLRVKFADPAETWVYVDPEMSQVLAQVNRLNRVERWLYNGLHSLDFAFWYSKRPLWDIVMIVLLAGGLTSSVLGMVMGIRRLRRGAKRLATWADVAPEAQPGTAVTGAVQRTTTAR
jgi:PepSY-associated TM region